MLCNSDSFLEFHFAFHLRYSLFGSDGKSKQVRSPEVHIQLPQIIRFVGGDSISPVTSRAEGLSLLMNYFGSNHTKSE